MTDRTLLVLATRNRGKLTELVQLLGDLPIDVRAVTELVPDFAVDETGSSFEENALLKARAAAAASGHWALADDSGLEVEALGGAPGIYSARYAGAGASDAENNMKLLAALGARHDAERAARFRCVLALVSGRLNTEETVAGEVSGRILPAPRGVAGFGYDPLFLHPASGRSFAELSGAEKEAVSHRGQALRALRPLLERLLSIAV